MIRKALLAATVLGIVAVTATVCIYGDDPPAQATSRPAETERGPQVVRRSGSTPGSPWSLGAVHRYTFELRSISDLNSESESGAVQFLFSLEGVLDLTIVEAGSDGIVWRGRLSDIAIALGSPSDPDGGLTGEAERHVRESLLADYYVHTSATGAISAVYFRSDANGTARAFIRTLMGPMQYVEPPNARSRTAWSTTERDRVGEFLADYRRNADGSTVKTKSKYVQIATDAGLLKISEEGMVKNESHASFLFTQGAPSSIQSHESVDLAIGGIFHTTTSGEASFHLSGFGFDAGAPSAWQRERSALHMTTLFEIEAGVANDGARLREVVGGATLPQLMAELRMLGGGALPKDFAAAAEKLRALFALEPDTIDRARDLLHGGDVTGQAADIVVGSIASAGTAQARQALLSIARDEDQETGLRQQALTMLAIAEKADPGAIDELTALATRGPEGVRNSALLAAGAMVRNLSSDQGDTEVQRLIERYRASVTMQDRLVALQALGNSGHPSIVPVIQTALQDGDPLIRAVAVESLRFVEGSSVDALIISVGRTDPDPQVRAAATRTLAFRNPGSR